MSTLKSECRKFSPNVFNKSKCQNCFRTKDAHSAEALENNRASRTVSKCGYLFVAPDWDFNVSINRTKRWQRRWFVLYDDGELTYALDEFPDTIPQGIIDMNKVLDVSDAESTTGNEFAIAITTPDKVHFIKGTSREESKWWFDVLSRVLPRHLSRGKHKRNATFPCGKATIPTPAVIAQEYCSEDDIRLNVYERPIRPKFLSSSELLRNDDWMPAPDADEDEDVFPPDPEDKLFTEKRNVEVQNVLNKLISQPVEIPDDSEFQTNHRDEKIPKDYLSQLEELDSRRRHRRYLKRENRVQRSQRGRVDGVSKMLPGKNRTDKNALNESSSSASNTNGSAMAAAEKLEYLESIHAGDNGLSSSPAPYTGFDEKDVLSVNEHPTTTNKDVLLLKSNLRKSESLKNIPSEARAEMLDHVSGLKRYHSFKGSSSSHRKIKPREGYSSLKRAKSAASESLSRSATSTPVMTMMQQDPKTTPDTTVYPPLSSEHTGEVFTRTGWLMRQTLSKDWSRHWFVLKDSSLTYYRDPSAEHCGIMDGILDLNQMWDGKKHILATETDDFRSMWMQSLQHASNLWSSASKEDFICSEIVLPEHTFYQGADRSVEPSSLSSLPYIYDNSGLLETSSSSDDQSEYFSLVDEDEISDLSSSPRTLPPSPPINRNMMSLVKEKSRIRSSSSQKTSPHSTGTLSSTLSDDHGVERTDDHCQQDINSSEHKETFHSLEQDDRIDYSEFAHELMNGGNVNPLNSSKGPTQADVSGPKLHIEDQLFKENGARGLENEQNLDSSSSKPFPYKYSNVSTPKTEARDECRMCSSVKSKLIAAKEEIRKLKKELKEAHASFDNLEMVSYKLEKDMKAKEDNYNSQIALMTAKIDDLTSKFSLAEKNYRQLKQKTLKNEGKERKRSSLKNREGLSLTKEYELKLCDLEKKIDLIENTIRKSSPESDKTDSSLSSMLGVLEENGALPYESSDTSTSTEQSTTGGKGLFSRLQTIGSKVNDINSLILEKDASTGDVENPKICLQVGDMDGSGTLDESDDWWTLSFNNSLKSLNKYLEEYPSTLLECQNMFSQKMREIFRWLTTSLQYICKEGIKSSITDEKIVLLQNFACFLDFCSREWSDNIQQPDQTELRHFITLVVDSISVLGRINSVEDFGTLVKFDITQCAFEVIIKTLCLTIAEYENSDPTDIFNLIINIPQLRFFCPFVNKIFPDSQEQQHISVSERLEQITAHQGSIMSSLQEAKKVRFETLWNILADVPVQDASIKKPRRINSILRYVTSVATGIQQIAELQLNGFLHQSSCLLKAEQSNIHEWCSQAKNVLKDSLDAFMDDLKEQCPMLHESTVSISDLSDVIRKEITCCVSELALLCITYSLLNSLLFYPIKPKDVSALDIGNSSASSEGWTDEQLRTIHLHSSNSFKNMALNECIQCTLLNSFLPDSSQKVNWGEFVRKYNYFNPRKNDLTNLNFEDFDSHLSSTCDSHFLEATPNNTKDMCNNIMCKECDNWTKKFCASEKQNELERKSLELKYNLEVKQLEECLIKSSEVHEQEMLEKENELVSATSQLQHLKMEYEDQISTLKNLYEQKLHFEFEKVDENSVRQVYKSEIEDLKEMFKKGLVAIESSHCRITTEMEKRHQEEMVLLRAEKERALELEAQATVTALEAIKKSHEQQLKEEIKLIQEDLMKKLKNNEQYGTFYSKYGNDLEKLKSEIVNITDIYSAKCLENIALEEKVNSLRHQLEAAHRELRVLLTRNKEMEDPIKI